MKSWLGLAAVAIALTGCISHEETIYTDSERVPVAFENERAGRLFYERLSKHGGNEKEQSKTDISIPFVFAHKQRRISGNNARFNEAVRQCDTNRDGLITEVEAGIFSRIK